MVGRGGEMAGRAANSDIVHAHLVQRSARTGVVVGESLRGHGRHPVSRARARLWPTDPGRGADYLAPVLREWRTGLCASYIIADRAGRAMEVGGAGCG